MNVASVTSRFVPEKSAGNSAPKVASAAASAPQSSAIVSLSDAARAAAATPPDSPLGLPPLLLPTRANAAKLAAQAGAGIAAALDAAGIPREPGFEVAIDDPNSPHVTVRGDRPDAKAIEDLINGDARLQLDIHNADAIASHVPAMERAAAYSAEYAAAQTQAQIDAVNARYSDLLSGLMPPAEIAMRFGKEGLQLSINGETATAA